MNNTPSFPIDRSRAATLHMTQSEARVLDAMATAGYRLLENAPDFAEHRETAAALLSRIEEEVRAGQELAERARTVEIVR